MFSALLAEHVGQVTINSADQLAKIRFSSPLKQGDGTLKLNFTGNLNDQMKGFYRCSYKTPDGEERISASTQFETTYARRAFPCWDEPAIKAQFEVTVVAPKDRTVLSNTDAVSVADYESDPSLQVVRFGVTPIMSTYLLAIVVGEYESIETKTERGTVVRVFTPIGKKEQGTFALDTAAKCLTLFEDYFNIPYPLKKIDHIAIPDFASGAMENWGLVTYRETVILADPQNSSSRTKELIAICVTHETAHQWFGNLVTMEWWTDLWLNEGFATFMEYLATDAIYPDFDIWSQFVTSSALVALRLDAMHNTHEIEIPVGHPGEVESIFDDISYNKGGSIIRMCHSWIGDDAFRKGMHDYLTKHAYKNAVTDNLWEALGRASNLPVGKMMSTWTQQKGHPVLHVNSRVEGNSTIYTLSQERFTIDGILDEKEKQSHWQIPISIISSKDPSKPVYSNLMEGKTLEVTLENMTPNDWIKLNPKMMSFYRVNYSTELLDALKPAITNKQLGSVDRLQIINDFFSMVMAGRAQTVNFLQMLSCYNQEDDYVTWAAIDDCIGKLNQLLIYTDYQQLLHTFGSQLYSNIFNKLGFDPSPSDSHTQNLLRMLVLGRLSRFGDEKVVAESKRRFHSHCNGVLMAPDIRKPVYEVIAAFGSDEEFNKLFEVSLLWLGKNFLS